MNVLEQLQSLGFREAPYQFYDGGDTTGPGPGGTDVGAENTADYGGPSSAEIAAADAIASLGLNAGKAGQTVESMAAEDIIGGIMARGGASVPGAATKSDLQSLANLGYGKMEGLNAKNPSQTVENLIASANVHAAVPVALSFMPGAGLARGLQTGAQFLADLSSGKLSPQDALADLGLTLASAITGQSKGTLAAAARGDFGEAAMSAAKSAITGALAQASGLPSGFVGAGVNAITSGLPSGGGYTGAPSGGSTDMAGGTTDSAVSGAGATDTAALGGDTSPSFDLGNLAPLFTVAALEDILTPQEKKDPQEQAQVRTLSPFGSMPYA